MGRQGPAFLDIDWCATRCSEADHWWSEYTYASLRSGDPHHLLRGHDMYKVGTGPVYAEGEMLAVIVHIDGGPRDDDVDAHLRIPEAVELRDFLDRAIANAMEAFHHFADRAVSGDAE